MDSFEQKLSSRVSEQVSHDERGDCDHDCACPCHDQRVSEYECPDECTCECHEDDDDEEKPTGAEVYGHPSTPLHQANAFSIGRNIEPEHDTTKHFMQLVALLAVIMMGIGLTPAIKKAWQAHFAPKPEAPKAEPLYENIGAKSCPVGMYAQSISPDGALVCSGSAGITCSTAQDPVASKSGEISCVDVAQIVVEHKIGTNVIVMTMRQGHAQLFTPAGKMEMRRGDTITATVEK